MRFIVCCLCAGFVVASLNFLSTTALAQGIYVTKGKNGPIFSNVPQPGAKEIDLKPLNVIEPPAPIAPTTPVVPADISSPANEVKSAESEESDAEEYRQKPASASVYGSFFVVYPENDGAVAANTAAFEVRLAVDPPLQLDQQHAFVVSINGRPVGQRFTSTEFMIPPAFWGDLLPPDNLSIQLDASIVDGEGRVLRQAEPVRFVMRHVVFHNLQRPFTPRPRHDRDIDSNSAKALPNTKPALENPSRAMIRSVDH